MPDKSGTWETGFPAVFAEQPVIDPSIPTSQRTDQRDRFRIFMRSSLRQSTTELFAVGLD
jgi:hypothetical protein